MGYQAGAQPWVRASDLLPMIHRFVPPDFQSRRHEFTRPYNAGGTLKLTQHHAFGIEVTRHLPITLDAVQKIVRRVIHGERLTLPVEIADAIAVAACTTLETEEVPIFFPTRAIATEAVEVFEEIRGLQFYRPDRQALVRELVLVAKQVRAQKPVVASSTALEIMGRRACPLRQQDVVYRTRARRVVAA